MLQLVFKLQNYPLFNPDILAGDLNCPVYIHAPILVSTSHLLTPPDAPYSPTHFLYPPNATNPFFVSSLHYPPIYYNIVSQFMPCVSISWNSLNSLLMLQSTNFTTYAATSRMKVFYKFLYILTAYIVQLNKLLYLIVVNYQKTYCGLSPLKLKIKSTEPSA